jgi:hypothetical protein
MKRTDIATIATIALISMGAAYLLATAIIGKPTASSVKVKTVDPITSAVTPPDKTVFNKDAINPTVEVIIGKNN